MEIKISFILRAVNHNLIIVQVMNIEMVRLN